jgi:hypothetical protein
MLLRKKWVYDQFLTQIVRQLSLLQREKYCRILRRALQRQNEVENRALNPPPQHQDKAKKKPGTCYCNFDNFAQLQQDLTFLITRRRGSCHGGFIHFHYGLYSLFFSFFFFT